jgi:hypothetical protein
MGSRLVAFIALFGALFAAPAAAQVTPATPQPDITYCHSTSREGGGPNSVTNPYVLHKSDANSIIKQGHGNHTGPIFPDTDANGSWGDIIPPFDYDGGHFPGLNWDAEGQTIVAANCEVVIEPLPPDETTTTTASTSTTAPPTGETEPPSSETTAPPTGETEPPSSETTAPPVGESEPGSSSTFVAEGSTVPPVGENTTTTVTLPGVPPATIASPPLTDPGVGVEIMPTVNAVVLIHHNGQVRVVELGTLSPAQRIMLEVVVDQTPTHLAFTGNHLGSILAAAAVLLFTGGVLVVRRRPRRS